MSYGGISILVAKCLPYKGFVGSALSRARATASGAAIARMASTGTGAYDFELKIAMEAVTLACGLTKSVQRKLLENETQSKTDNSPVTIADYGSQAVVSWALERQLPAGTFSMIAEEDSEDLRKEDGKAMLQRITELVNSIPSKDAVLSSEDVLCAIDRGKAEGGVQGRHWVLDPIDGTKGFLRGEQYAIALALLDRGSVVLGVLGCPNLPLSGLSDDGSSPVGCLFTAVRGAGTTVHAIDRSVQPRKVRVSDLSDPALAAFCESYESAHSKHDLTSGIAKMLGVTASPIRMDSQAKYGAMARGDAAIYLRFPHKGYREKIWDHAAGSIVVEEAGGVVVDAAGRALDFSKGRYLDLDTGIIATNPSLLTAVLTAVETCVGSKSFL
ncbi:SAL1 phosphatase [Selaginella moellendorffii]|uniref:SAL1 phosphatase n=1 Tax=Selaginella moellendorffii TaxID=88036 RepID=UPI000D1C7424|nr:SAL1 phosphatase [Selaginella moellendorffii]|eukprot:XP_002972451.2 SAL1 phosphatase [Selaginella moellendorffii]